MKKEYMKPEMAAIKVQAEQAILATSTVALSMDSSNPLGELDEFD